VLLLLVISAVLLLLGLAVATTNLLQRSRQQRQVERAIDRALQQPIQASAADTQSSTDRNLWQRGLHLLEALGRRFESGQLARLLLTDEDRLLLNQARDLPRPAIGADVRASVVAMPVAAITRRAFCVRSARSIRMRTVDAEAHPGRMG
jgi:hypothetical protein